MATINNFNATEVEPSGDFEPLPEGKYLAMIKASEMKPTKAGHGQYLELTFQILDGPYKDRCVWARLNLENPNPAAVEIAQRDLSAICRAVGVLTLHDSNELHNRPLVITVKLRRRKDTGEFTNEIKRFAPPAGLPGPAAPSTEPWHR